MPQFDITRYQDQLNLLHTHICPRQVLGMRMGELAGDYLGLDLPVLRQQHDKRLFVFVETDGCFVDGVMVATGCSLGHRTMRLEDQGKTAATFVDTSRHDQSGLRIWPHPLARQRAMDMAPGASSRWHAQLDGYQHMANADLLCTRVVTLTVSMQAIISKPGLRQECAVCGEEIMNERGILRGDVILCRTCAGESRYYEVTTPSD